MVFPSLLAVMYFFSLFIYLYPEPTSKCTVLLVHFGNFCVFVTAVCFVLGCGQLLCVSYLDLCVFSPRSLAVFWMPKCQACRLEGECERVARSDLFTAKQIRTVVILNYRAEKSLRVSWHVAAIIVRRPLFTDTKQTVNGTQYPELLDVIHHFILNVY